MCTVLLPPGGYPIAVKKHIISHQDFDVRLYLVHNIHGTGMYISYYGYVISVKMAFIRVVETRC